MPLELMVKALSGVPVVEEPSLAFELRYGALMELSNLGESMRLYGGGYSRPST